MNICTKSNQKLFLSTLDQYISRTYEDRRSQLIISTLILEAITMASRVWAHKLVYFIVKNFVKKYIVGIWPDHHLKIKK